MRNMPSVPKFVLRLVVAIGAIHLCFSAAMTGFVERQCPNRILNVRVLEPTEWRARNQIVASYFDAGRRDGRPLIGFVGSSFSWGFPYSEEASLSQALVEARPDRRIINAGVLSYGLDGVHQLTKIAELQNCRFETLFVEIPIVNETAYLAGQSVPERWRDHYPQARDEVAFVRGMSHFGWILRSPSSFDLATVAAEEAALVDPLQRNRFVQPTPGYFTARATFERLRPTYSRKLVATLESARRIADRVVAYPSLICLSGGEFANYDVAALRDQIEETVVMCGSVPEVVAIRPTDRFLTDRTLFLNLTHLNVRGNAEFGAWLASELRRAELEEATRRGPDATTIVRSTGS
jgi:hypothetical protein